jgi:hypothetical protein
MVICFLSLESKSRSGSKSYRSTNDMIDRDMELLKSSRIYDEDEGIYIFDFHSSRLNVCH